METVIAAFEISENDLFRANAWVFFRRWYIAAFYLLNGFLLVYLVWALATRGFTLADLRGFIIPGLFFIVIPITLYTSSRSTVRSLPPQQRLQRYEFTIDAVRMNTGLSLALVAWEAVHRVVETRSAFYLYLQKSICHVVPKRGLQTGADVDRLRALLAAKLGSKARLRRSGADDQVIGGG